MKLCKIKKSDIDKKGRGLYATRDIKEGTKIIDYVGKLVTKKQTEESDKYDNSKPIYLLNVLEYWNLFINNLYHMIKIGFLEKEAINYFKVCKTVDEIFLDLKDKGLTES